jgi:hypothetical protein
MNGLAENPNSPPNPEGRLKTLWLSIVRFFRQDVGSLFGVPTHELPPPSATEKPESLVDPAKLDLIRKRREILDWRDTSLIKLSFKGRELFHEFSYHVDQMLNDVSIWNTLFPDHSDEALSADFRRMVGEPFLAERDKVAREFHALFPEVAATAKFFLPRANVGDMSRLKHISFKKSNRNLIIDGIEITLMGDQGLAGQSQHEIVTVARRLLEVLSHADANSV